MLEERITVELSAKIVEQLEAKGLETEDLLGLARYALAEELYLSHTLSLGLAAELAGLERAHFAKRLDERDLTLLHLPQDELDKELQTVQTMLKREGTQ